MTGESEYLGFGCKTLLKKRPSNTGWFYSFATYTRSQALVTAVGLFLKGHSQLCGCAVLDTSFFDSEKSLPQPEIKAHLEIRFIFCSVFLDFQSFTEKICL